MANNTDTYAARGVSSQKEAVSNAAKSVGEDKGLFPGAFCKIMQDPRNKNYVMIPHADGAGTKSSLAYIYWKETGDTSVFAGIIQDSIVMNLDDIACVGGILGDTWLMSSIDRNPKKIPDEILPILFQADYDFRQKMAGYGINIYGGAGETADVPDTARTLIVNHSTLTRMKKNDVIDNSRISVGDYIVGLSSSGRASYETEFNSGIGSNGLTNARHDLLHSDYREKYPESFEPELLKDNLAYNGSFHVTQKMPLSKINPELLIEIGKLILSPTRTYAPVLMEIFKQIGTKRINGIVHCSGGGQTKILKSLKYGLSAHKTDLFEVPYLFNLIQSESNLSWEQMYEKFNMGHRMEICVPDICDVLKIIDISKSLGVNAKIIGSINLSENSNEKNVRITTLKGKLGPQLKYSATRQH
ncbi:MAG: phosphoribosylformylglycinamidine cyclo-ligase [Alphaproteobacteria bacterium]|nr:phosphoribosylformylglycinamidine cyclo-ligase [Alphaproteobacteria bacterium]